MHALGERLTRLADEIAGIHQRLGLHREHIQRLQAKLAAEAPETSSSSVDHKETP